MTSRRPGFRLAFIVAWAFCLAGLFSLSPFAVAQTVVPLATVQTTNRLERVEVRVKPAGARDVFLVEDAQRNLIYEVRWSDDSLQMMSPDAYSRLVFDDFRQQSFLYVLLNITSTAGVIWVGLGLLGQVLFTGRMVVQWVVSERRKRSVVPVIFWWMSLGGATMLLVYFIWRRDIVGVLGQGMGWFIYVRNLMLIYAKGPAVDDAEAEMVGELDPASATPSPAATALTNADAGDASLR